MPVSFFSEEQRSRHGRYAGEPSDEQLARYFHLDDADHEWIALRRGDHNRLGCALQLCTARFLGAFLEDVREAPAGVVAHLARQLGIFLLPGEALAYGASNHRWEHTAEIRQRGGYRELAFDAAARFELSRWLYALCWTGTDRPSVLFDRATAWMLARKVLLPGVSALERPTTSWWQQRDWTPNPRTSLARVAGRVARFSLLTGRRCLPVCHARRIEQRR